jgi:hypothetical protein
MISEMPKDMEPMKSFLEVRSQSQISTRSLRSLSSGFRSKVSVCKKRVVKVLKCFLRVLFFGI